MDGRDALIYLDLKYEHAWDNIYEAVMHKDVPCENNATQIFLDTKLFAMLSEGYKVITLIDDNFPEAIKNTVKPPFVIWYKCKLEDLVDRYFEHLRVISPLRIDDRVLIE